MTVDRMRNLIARLRATPSNKTMLKVALGNGQDISVPGLGYEEHNGTLQLEAASAIESLLATQSSKKLTLKELEQVLAQDTENADMWRLHAQAFDAVLNDLYAIMVDPCASGSIKRDDLIKAIRAAAIRDREAGSAPSAIEPTARELDLAMMVRRLAARIKLRSKSGPHATPDTALSESAIDFLKRLGLEGSPLRDEPRLEQSAPTDGRVAK